MKKTNSLATVRQRLSEQVAGGYYTNLTRKILIFMGRPFRVRPTNAFFIEGSALILILAGIVWAALILFVFEPGRQALDDFLIFLPLMLIIYLGVVGTQKYWQMTASVISNHLLNAMSAEEDFQDLESWLKSWTNRRAELVWGILFAIVFDAYFIITAILTGETTPRIPVIIAFLPMIIQTGLLFYEFARAINMPSRIKRYQIKLYQTDPASSEIIARLAGLFTAFIFMIAMIASVVTLLLAAFNPLLISGSIFVITLGWLPLILAFVVSQSALRHIIQYGKQKALTEIQAKIEKLQSRKEIPDTETLNHIRALMDYHDYVKSRRDSTFDVQTGLNFLNSLLFPVIGFLLGNLKELLTFFSK